MTPGRFRSCTLIGVVAGLLLVLNVGCAAPPLAGQAGLPQSGPRPSELVATDLCPFGLPRATVDSGDSFELVVHTGFAALESVRYKLPLWVCERLEPGQLSGKLPRPPDSAFRPDPLLPTGERSELQDYAHSGYDRGHMAPAGDQTVDPTLKSETFFLSNMAPQAAALNRQVWAKLEDLVRGWARERSQLHVITGPLFLEPAGGGVKSIGSDAVGVPTHFYKIAVSDGPGAPLEVIAFVLENRGYDKPWDFAQDEISVDWVEAHAGFDFMPDLPAEQASGLESAVPPLWQ